MAACLLVVGVAVLAYREYYRNWFWEGHPAELAWCGSRYHRAPPAVSGAIARRDGRLHVVGHAPPVVGSPMVTNLPPELVKRREREEQVCSTDLLLEVGDDRYLPYELMGGP